MAKSQTVLSAENGPVYPADDAVQPVAETTAAKADTSFFTDPDVSQKYRAVFGHDKRVTVIGIYSGPLSKISLAAADKMFAQKDNQLALLTP